MGAVKLPLARPRADVGTAGEPKRWLRQRMLWCWASLPAIREGLRGEGPGGEATFGGESDRSGMEGVSGAGRKDGDCVRLRCGGERCGEPTGRRGGPPPPHTRCSAKAALEAEPAWCGRPRSQPPAPRRSLPVWRPSPAPPLQGLAPTGLQAAATAAAAPSAGGGRSSLGVGDLGLPQHSLPAVALGCTSRRCLGAPMGGIEERAAGGGRSPGIDGAEATAVSIVGGGRSFGVEGGERILSPELARARRWGRGEVGRQARPPALTSLTGEVAAALRRACAPESGVGTKLGSKAILLVIGGGRAPAPFTAPAGPRSAAAARSDGADGGGVWLREEELLRRGLVPGTTSLSGVAELLWIWIQSTPSGGFSRSSSRCTSS